MKREIYFMPLGGAQCVGASCYYLRLGDANIILDAGIGTDENLMFEPATYALVTSRFMESMHDVNHIFISHAHMDHVGYLVRMMGEAVNAQVYMTEMTRTLSEYQLYDTAYGKSRYRREKREEKRLAVQRMFEKITMVSFLETLRLANYSVTFFPAGHIPGAVMMLFEYKNYRILYTGDYSLDSTPLTGGCVIPQGMTIDALIMCGLHAKHPNYVHRQEDVFRRIHTIFEQVTKYKENVFCRLQQISKGIEFIKMLNNWNERSKEKIEIYIDETIYPIVEKLEQLSIPLMTEHCHYFQGKIPDVPHILISQKSGSKMVSRYKIMKIIFSLHEDFSGMENFIKQINPKQAFLVHCAPDLRDEEYTIEQKLMMDVECRTQFTFAEQNEMYKI